MDVIAGKYIENSPNSTEGDESLQVDKVAGLWKQHEALLLATESSSQTSNVSSHGEYKPITTEILSQVEPVGFGVSFYYFTKRAVTQQLRRASTHMVADLLLETFAGAIVGCLYLQLQFQDTVKYEMFVLFWRTAPFVFLIFFYCGFYIFQKHYRFVTFGGLALGLTISISSLRVFGDERVVFWREASMNLDM